MEGEEYFEQSRQQLWDFLTNMTFLSRCLPSVDHVLRTDAHSLECRVQPHLSFLRGTLQVRLEMIDRQPPEYGRIQIHAEGIGCSIDIETSFALSELDRQTADAPDAGAGIAGNTCLQWTAEVQQLGGLLKPVSRGLIEAAARKIIADGWSNFRQEVSAG